MKIRVLPLTITAAISAALLFGGWTVYGRFAVENPLDRVAASLPGVQSADAEMTAGEIQLNVKLDPDADLASLYQRIKTDGERQIGSRKLTLNVASDPSETLEKAWRYALFDVAEAMETRHYSGIREAMDKLSAQFPGVTAETGMDEDNVYIRLKAGQAAKFVVLPREAGTLEVWPNA